ncbi:MAG: tetratricopeptide repeat protein [Polyangiaceae bacterium]
MKRSMTRARFWGRGLGSPAMAVAIAAIGTACSSSTPPPKHDEELRADPPVVTATNSASTLKKGNPEADRGVAFAKAGKFDEAITHLRAGVEADATNAEAAFYLAVCLEQTQGDRKEIEKLYKRAFDADPKLVDAALNLASMYLEDPPRPKEAIQVLDKALKQAPGDPKLLTNLGVAYALSGERDKAKKAYEDALQHDDSAELHFALAALLFEEKLADQALPHLLKAAAGFQDDADRLAAIGVMLGPAKAYSDCVKVFNRAIELKANVSEFWVRRGLCKHELKKELDASKDFERAIKLDPNFQPAHYYLGRSLLAQKDKNGARQAFKNAVKLGKDTPIGKQAQEQLDRTR